MADKGFEWCDSNGNVKRIEDIDDATGKKYLYDETKTAIGSLEILLNPSFNTEVSVSVSASSTSVVEKGVYYVRADSGVSVEYYNGSAWISITTPCFIVSDGSNVRFNNTTTATANGYLVQIS